MYKDEYHPQIKKDLKKLDPKLRKTIEAECIPEILSAPEKGDTLVGDLRGIRSYHLTFVKKEYRIAYVIQEDIKTVSVLMIGKREAFYALLKRRIKT
ncbi:MAG: type II toxin-antitoxin system mRNA interferase toxin, RelE/StbE family [Desulfobacteraceae bacterium]|nr:type II toxin-antitoxin system mRNA interferase toxin, RelE/StbE family [Desulfobacteraceae bacterium]